jgi:hypothetical protein
MTYHLNLTSHYVESIPAVLIVESDYGHSDLSLSADPSPPSRPIVQLSLTGIMISVLGIGSTEGKHATEKAIN